jgi:antitoxin (DNA-binding transcriptional repressor) of toxin-antitoxin stability system
MKTIPIGEAQAQLGDLVAEACRGEEIVLTDGSRQVRLEPRATLDPEEDSPELEAELLKAVDGPFAPYSSAEMQRLGERILGEKPRA